SWPCGASVVQARGASPPSLRYTLCCSSEPYGNKLRYARFLHRDTIQNRSDAHRFLAMGDEHELGLHAHLLDEFGEAANVGFVEWCIDFVENAEWARRVLKDSDQQGQGGKGLFAARQQQYVLQLFARRRRHDVDAAFGAVFFVGEPHEGVPAPKQLTERELEVLVDLVEGLLEL